MYIKHQPKDKNHPKDKPSNTNLGAFLPGEVGGPYYDTSEAEAVRLVANGDFVEVDADGKEVSKPKAETETKPKSKK